MTDIPDDIKHMKPVISETPDAAAPSLREALERTLANFEAVLARRPVRDATETIAEARAALASTEPAPLINANPGGTPIFMEDGPAVTEGLECPMCGGVGRIFNITDAVNDAIHAGAVALAPVLPVADEPDEEYSDGLSAEQPDHE